MKTFEEFRDKEKDAYLKKNFQARHMLKEVKNFQQKMHLLAHNLETLIWLDNLGWELGGMYFYSEHVELWFIRPNHSQEDNEESVYQLSKVYEFGLSQIAMSNTLYWSSTPINTFKELDQPTILTFNMGTEIPSSFKVVETYIPPSEGRISRAYVCSNS